jgi:hypothetical protein
VAQGTEELLNQDTLELEDSMITLVAPASGPTMMDVVLRLSARAGAMLRIVSVRSRAAPAQALRKMCPRAVRVQFINE